jgi:hypothetical protein
MSSKSSFFYFLLLVLLAISDKSSAQIKLKLELRDISQKDKIISIYSTTIGPQIYTFSLSA